MTQHETIGWGLLKKSLPDMIGYIFFLAILIWLHPTIWVVGLIVTAYILIKLLAHKRFKIKSYAKTCVIAWAFIGLMYGIRYFIGGLWALIIAHLCGIAMVAVSQWAFIKECDRQIKQQLDIIRKKTKGDDDGREG